MVYLKRFPYILATFMGIVVGIVSYISGVEIDEIYIRMLSGIVLFYFLGLIIRGFVFSMQKDLEKKIKEDINENDESIENVSANDFEENNENEWTSLHETVKKVGE